MSGSSSSHVRVTPYDHKGAGRLPPFASQIIAMGRAEPSPPLTQTNEEALEAKLRTIFILSQEHKEQELRKLEELIHNQVKLFITSLDHADEIASLKMENLIKEADLDKKQKHDVLERVANDFIDTETNIELAVKTLKDIATPEYFSDV